MAILETGRMGKTGPLCHVYQPLPTAFIGYLLAFVREKSDNPLMNGKKSPLFAALTLFLPERCRVCRRPSPTALCPDCLAAVAYCDEESGDALEPPCRCLCLYEQPVAGLIHRLKYAADRTVLPALAAIAAQCGGVSDEKADLIIPVPLYTSRLRQRGLNQSLLLARLFFPERRKDIRGDLLIRHRPTTPQTELSGAARRQNLKDAFSLALESETLSGKRLLLVDDVRTTGSTLTECGRVLLAHGAESVCYLAMARADLPASSPDPGGKK